MRYEEVLKTFIEFFSREGIDYALTGDLALHVYGHPHTRPRFDFVVDSVSREQTYEFMDRQGFKESYKSENVSIFQSAVHKVAFIFGNVRPAIPGLFFEGAVVPVIDPLRRLPLNAEDIDVLDSGTMQSIDFQAWMDLMVAIGPRRSGAFPTEPFEL